MGPVDTLVKGARILKTFLVWLLVAAVLIVLLFAGLSLYSRKAPELRSSATPLEDCPDRPNCVSSRAPTDDPHWVAPLAFDDPPRQAWARAVQALRDMGGTIVQEDPGYLWAEFRTPLFRFIDDLELRLDERVGIIHVRSASRVGYSDRGVNRQRVEELREALGRP